MQDYGLVSIITPAWACGKYIADTIRSVQAQTYTHWELLVQDDCSDDETRSIVKRFADSDARIKYESNGQHVDAAIARNIALRRAEGRWIAFLDADDLWAPEKLERQLTFMVGGNCHFSYTAYEVIDADGMPLGHLLSGPRHVGKFAMRCFCWPGCLTVMYDRDAVGLVQIADIKKNNDYAMWLKVIRKADCYLLPECLAKYRSGRAGSVSTHGYATKIRWHYRLWHEAEGLNPVASVFWTAMNIVFAVFKKMLYIKAVHGNGR